MKNRIHQSLESSCIKISSVLSDIFGKSGRHILDGLLEGKNIDEILKGIKSKRVMKKEQELRDAIKNSLDLAKILLIQNFLELIEEIQKKIKKLDTEIMSRIERMKENIEIAMSIPGISFVSASAILAEIGDYRDFLNGEKLAAWCGLTPRVSQSADMLVTGSITKQGSKHVRRMLVQVAHAISRTKNSALKRFFLKIQLKKGAKKAAVALARKILCILHHLLVNKEKYQENGNIKPKSFKFDRTSSPIQITEEDMINTLVKAGYIIKKKGCQGVHIAPTFFG
jgi:transposase